MTYGDLLLLQTLLTRLAPTIGRCWELTAVSDRVAHLIDREQAARSSPQTAQSGLTLNPTRPELHRRRHAKSERDAE